MITFVKENKRTSVFGILAILSELIRNNPALISFLPDAVEGYVFGASSLIFGVLTVISARDAKTPSQVELEKVQKESEKAQLKTEIKEETAVLVKEAKDLVDEKAAEIAQVAQAIPQIVSAHAAQAVESLVVKEIKTDSITVTDKEKQNES